jgi:hypothetical protein
VKIVPLKPHEAALLKRRQRKLQSEVDLMLELLERIRPPGVRLTHHDLADIIGCSHGLIYLEEQTALRKMQHEARKLGLTGLEKMLVAA